MARVARFKGTFTLIGEDGKTVELTKNIDQMVQFTEMVQHVMSIAALQTDVSIDFGGVTSAKAVYLDPRGATGSCIAVQVKFENNTNTAFTVDKPTVVFGAITAVFITTAADAITLEAVIVGT